MKTKKVLALLSAVALVVALSMPQVSAQEQQGNTKGCCRTECCKAECSKECKEECTKTGKCECKAECAKKECAKDCKKADKCKKQCSKKK